MQSSAAITSGATTRPGELERLVEHLLDFGVDPRDGFLVEPAPKKGEGVTQSPALDLFVGAITERHRSLGCVMTDKPIRPAFKEAGAATVSCLCDRGLGRRQDGFDVHPIDGVGRHPIGGRARHGRPGGGAFRCRRDGVAVVFADEDHGEVPSRGQVQVSCSTPWLRPPSPKKLTATRSEPSCWPAQAAPAAQGRAGRDDPVCAVDAEGKVGDVHRPAVPVIRSCRPSQELGKHSRGRDSLGDYVTVAAVGAGDDVVDAQSGADAGGDGFLSDVLVSHPSDLVGIHELHDPLLEAADGSHRPVQLLAHAGTGSSGGSPLTARSASSTARSRTSLSASSVKAAA